VSDPQVIPATLWEVPEAQLLSALGGELLGEGIGFSGEEAGRRRRFAAATVVDALAAIAGRPSATIVAVILLRRGAERVCG
jgi:hypothetical protein